MNQELPKFHETFNPILETLSDGKIIHHRDLLQKVLNKYYSHLPNDLLSQKTKSGEVLIMNRIAWGKSYLKKGGFIDYPKRGMVQITEKGKSQHDHLSLRDIEEENDFFSFYKEENRRLNDDSIEIKHASPQDLMETGYSKIKAQVKEDLLRKLKNIDPFYFENVILRLLNRMGYGEYRETSKTGDGGIDGIINEDKLGLDKIYLQAKRYGDNKVREKDIRNFIGAMSGDTTKGVFVTTSSFDDGAIKKASEAHHTIILIDGEQLVDLMHEYNVGVQIKMTYEVKEIDEDFFEGQ